MSFQIKKTGRLAPILENTFSKDISLSLLKTGKFAEKERPLVDVMIRIMEDGKPVNAENVYLYSKDISLLIYYMAYVDLIDSFKYK